MRRSWGLSLVCALILAAPLVTVADAQAQEDEDARTVLNSLGDSQADLVYTPVTPCRIIDTRLAGGPIPAGTTRDFLVTGTDYSAQGGSATGCGVPFGPTTAVMVNFVAAKPAGGGNVRVTPFGKPIPLAAILNFTTGVTLGNGLAVATCDPSSTTCTSDITIQVDKNATDLVADVQGYFSSVKGVLTGAQAPLEVSGANVRLSTSGCAAGYVWKYNGSAWACSPDIDTNTTYAAGTGLSLSGTTFSVNPAALGRSPALSWYDSSSGFPSAWLSADWGNVFSVSITAPAVAGHVVAIATADIHCYNNCVDISVVHILTDVNGGTTGVRTTDYLRSESNPVVHPTLLGVFPIAAGATKTVYWRAIVPAYVTWGDTGVFNPKIMLMFVPD
jgi:hypothetical protein